MTYKVQGWRQGNGELWKVNTYINVVDSLVEVAPELSWVVTQISYSLNSDGSSVSMILKPEETFDAVVEPDTKKVIIEDVEIKKNSGRI